MWPSAAACARCWLAATAGSRVAGDEAGSAARQTRQQPALPARIQRQLRLQAKHSQPNHIISCVDLALDLAWWGLVYVSLPVAIGAAAALPFWLKRRVLLGNAIGSAVIAVIMIAYIIQLFASLISIGFLTQANLLPVGLLVLVGWADVLVLFFLSSAVENRVKRRVVNPDDF